MMYAEQLHYEATQIIKQFQVPDLMVKAGISSEGPGQNRYQLRVMELPVNDISLGESIQYDINGDTPDQVLQGLRNQLEQDAYHITEELPF